MKPIKNQVLDYIIENWPRTTKEPSEGIPYPFTSPCVSGMYIDFFYWDNYFFNKGLLISGMYEQVRNNIRDIAYYINKMGFMPNAQHILDRSQPPVFPLCIWDYYEATKDIEFIKELMPTILKEYKFFIDNRKSGVEGLHSFGCSPKDDSIIMINYDGLHERVDEYGETYEEKIQIGKDIMAIAESGLDFNMRFRTSKSKISAHEFAHVDINSFLYIDEVTIAKMLHIIGNDALAKDFEEASLKRKALMEEYFYDKEQGIYVDYNFIDKSHSHVVTAASIYPQAFGVSTNKEAVKKVVDQLELPYGVSCAAYRGEDFYYQWDYPVLWGETSYIVYMALKNVGLDETAKRIKDKFMSVVENQFKKTHELWEKYDARNGEIMNREYNAPPFMGWTAAMYQWFAMIKD